MIYKKIIYMILICKLLYAVDFEFNQHMFLEKKNNFLRNPSFKIPNEPQNFAVINDTFYISDLAAKRIIIYSNNNDIKLIELNYFPRTIKINSNNIFILSSLENKIYKYDKEFKLITTYKLMQTEDFEIDSNGNIYFITTVGRTISRYVFCIVDCKNRKIKKFDVDFTLFVVEDYNIIATDNSTISIYDLNLTKICENQFSILNKIRAFVFHQNNNYKLIFQPENLILLMYEDEIIDKKYLPLADKYIATPDIDYGVVFYENYFSFVTNDGFYIYKINLIHCTN